MARQTWSPDHGVGLLVEDGYLLTRSGGAAGGGGGSGGLAPGQGIQVGGGTFPSVATEFARTGGGSVAAYAALDVLSTAAGAVIEFPNCARVAGGGGVIIGARLMISVSTQTWRPRLHLYRSAPAAIADNNPFTLLYANKLIRLIPITFPALSTEGTGSDSAEATTFDVRIPYVCAATSLFGILETLDAISASVSAQTFQPELWVVRD